MDQQLPTAQPQVPEIPHNQVVAGPAKKTSPISEILSGVKDRFSNIFSRLTFISPKAKKIISILIAFLVIVALAAVFVPLIKKLVQKPVEETPVVETSQLTLTARKPSRYATDEAVLKVESEVGALEADLNALEVKESNLNPPPLNWDVNFEE
jgi:hypothetical protein